MRKAQSRLSRNPPPTTSAATKSLSRKPINQNQIKRATKRHHTSLLKRFWQQLPTLMMAAPFLGASYYILTSIHPYQIKNFLAPNSYLPLLASTFLGSFFLLSFLFLSTRRGFLLSLMLNLVLFFKLQQVIFNWQLVVSLVIFFVIIESTLIVISKLLTPKK